MSKIFIAIYHLLQRNKWLLFSSLLVLMCLAVLTFLRMDLEEDITTILPANKEITKFNESFLKSELSNRIIIHLSSKDENAEILTKFCQDIVERLGEDADSSLIKSITYQIDESLFETTSTFMLNQIPFFLQSKDYENLSQLTSTDEINERIKGAYKALISPAGFAFKKNIQADPLGISTLAFEQLNNFQIDENFELYNNYFLTKDRKHLLFFVLPSGNASESTQNANLISLIKNVGSTINAEKYTDLKFEYFGGPAVSVANASRIKKDVTLTVSIALLVLLFLIYSFYRDLKIFFFILVPVLAGTALSVIILGNLKSSISLISLGIGSVLIGITIDFSIHLFTHFKKKQNPVLVLEDISFPVLISALTTSAAFLCLYLIRSEALKDLGLFAALSVLCVAISALIMIPQLFSNKTKTNNTNKKTFIDKIASYPFHENKILLFTLIALSITCAFFANKVSFERDLNKINYMPADLLKAEEHINEISDATKRSIHLIAYDGDENKALEISEAANKSLTKLKEGDKINSFSSPTMLLSSKAEQSEKINNWNKFWTAEKIGQVKTDINNSSQALGFKASAFNAFFKLLDKEFQPKSLTAFDAISKTILQDKVSRNEDQTTLMTTVRVDSDQKQHVREALKGIEGLSIVDNEYIVHQFVDTLKEDFNKLVWWSLFFVFIILNFVYGRAELALVAFIPICLSWIITLGMMNLLDIKFNIVNIIITSFIFGLGIDYAIFIMRGLLQEYETGERNLHSYKTSILISGMTTLTGIGVMIFAQHPALRSIALVSIIGITSVLLCSFVFQPKMFYWLTGNRDNRRSFPLTFSNMGKTIWVYLALAFGCILLTIIGIIINVFFFIPKEIRKSVFHKFIYWFSKIHIKASFLNRVSYENIPKEDFSKPAIIIANHKSLIDTPLFFQLTPKLIIITNDWVNKFPLYRLVCNMADFYSISSGAELLLENLQERVDNGYSIAIFPEGTRSPSEEMLRFKKGAFFLAEKLNLDIVPMFIHGTQPFLGKGKFWGRANDIHVKIENRIKIDDNSFGDNYSERCKAISRWFKKEYHDFRIEKEDMHYHRERLVYNYIYKGPVTEWYMKVKTKMEDNYQVFDEIIPKAAKISDVGCGLGFMTYFLALKSKHRSFVSMDYDANKIAVANNCEVKSDQIKFIHGDIKEQPFENSDVFIIADVLHYLLPEEQFKILDKCADKLNPEGMIILRDGDADLQERHQGTKLTEIFSTNIGFNKTQNKLHFLSGKSIRAWAETKNLNLRLIDETKFTSNVIFVMQSNK